MHQKYLPSFAKRNGRITNSQKKNLELFKSFEIKNLEDLKYSLKKYSKCALEIGFGNGENLINQAILNPNTLHIGSEVYKSGIGSLIGAINQKKLSNIKIFQNDVRDLFDSEPEEIFDLIIIICPDHEEFTQTPDSHLKGNKCSKCSKVHNYTTTEWIESAKKKNGEK